MIKPPPILTPEKIEAQYALMKQAKQDKVNPKLTIEEWRGRELRRWATEQMKKEGK